MEKDKNTGSETTADIVSQGFRRQSENEVWAGGYFLYEKGEERRIVLNDTVVCSYSTAPQPDRSHEKNWYGF